MVVLALALLTWLLARAPLVAPISLYAASSSTVGFYSTSHIIAAMAALAGLAAPLAAVRGRVALPAWPILVALALPLAAMGMATARAVYPHDARTDLALAGAMALFAVALAGSVGRLLQVALWATAMGGCVLAALAFRQFAAGQPSPLAWTGAAAAMIPVRVTATLGNPNVLAAVLLLCLGAALALGWAGLAPAVPVTAALLLTFSRGAYLGLGATALATLLLVPRARRRWALAAVAVLAATAFVVHLRVPAVALRAASIGVGASDNASRFFTWLDALQVWRAHPLTGAGPGGLEALYAVMAPRGWHGNFTYTVVPSSADNDLLEWAAEGGLLAVLALAAALALVALAVARALRPAGPGARATAAPLIAAFLGIAVQGLFEVTAYALPVQAVMAWSFAMLLAASGTVREHRLGWSRLLAAPALAACGALALVLWSVWPAYQAYAAGFATFAAGHPAAAVPDLARAATLDPTSARAQAAAGDAAVLAVYAGQASLAPAAAARLAAALRLDPYDGSVWSVASALETKLGQPLAAACAQQAAVHTRPYDPFQAFDLGRQLTALGQAAAGRADLAYAAWTFGPTLAVMAEHGQTGPYYRQGQQEEAAAARAGPPPSQPVEPLSAAVCAPALAAAGVPGDAWVTAMGTGPRPAGGLGPLAPLARWLVRAAGKASS
jgi:O-antigen ligase